MTIPQCARVALFKLDPVPRRELEAIIPMAVSNNHTSFDKLNMKNKSFDIPNSRVRSPSVTRVMGGGGGG